MNVWRCELYADVLLAFPCVTIHVRAQSLAEAKELVTAELAVIDVLLRPGELFLEENPVVEFDAAPIVLTRYVPDF